MIFILFLFLFFEIFRNIYICINKISGFRKRNAQIVEEIQIQIKKGFPRKIRKIEYMKKQQINLKGKYSDNCF